MKTIHFYFICMLLLMGAGYFVLQSQYPVTHPSVTAKSEPFNRHKGKKLVVAVPVGNAGMIAVQKKKNEIPSLGDLITKYEHLDESELDQDARKVDEEISKSGLIERANEGQLDEGEALALRKLLRRYHAIQIARFEESQS